MIEYRPTRSPWAVPFGFETFEMVYVLKAGTDVYSGKSGALVRETVTEDREIHYGVAHVYDDGWSGPADNGDRIRILVHPGTDADLTAPGYTMVIESLAGRPRSWCSNVESALAEAKSVLLQRQSYRTKLSWATAARDLGGGQPVN